jgi:hypothetical protein
MPENYSRGTKRKRDRTNENVLKRVQTLLEKCDELVEFYNAEVYLLVRRGKVWEYTTSTCENCRCWPLTPDEIVSPLSQFDVMSIYKPPQAKHYPLPIRQTPKEFASRKSKTSEN